MVRPAALRFVLVLLTLSTLNAAAVPKKHLVMDQRFLQGETFAPSQAPALSATPTLSDIPSSNTSTFAPTSTSAPVSASSTISAAPSTFVSQVPTSPLSSEAESLQELCTSTGGQVSTALCCTNSSPFPSQILIGACGCSPQNSQDTNVCQCPDGLAFDTTWGCIDRGAYLDCQRVGGMIYNDYCCESEDDFPNTCMMGACGCSSENSKPVLKCQCPDNKCWNGKDCMM